MNSDIDFAFAYLRHVLGFIGIDDVRCIGADQLMQDESGALSRAEAQIRLAA